MFNQPPPRDDNKDQPKRMGPGPGRPVKIEKAKDPAGAVFRLAQYLLPFKIALVIVLVLLVVASVLSLLGPYLIGVAIDDFIAARDPVGLVRVSILLLLVFVSGNLFEAASNFTMARVSQMALKNLRSDLFGHLQKLPIKFFDTHTAGGLMSRLTNDIDAINQAVSQNVVALIASTLTLVGILIAMFVLNFYLALASILVVPIMFWFTNFVARYTRKGFRDLQKDLGELNGVMEESISGLRVMKAFRRNASAIDNFRKRNEAAYHSGVRANSYALLLMPLTNQLGNLFIIVIAGIGGG
jgi:ATP-binding cassette, subfamily B, multidrug efflux pump